MRTPPLTGWFNAETAAPVRPGYYLTSVYYAHPGNFLYWDGREWFISKDGCRTSTFNLYWRGLTAPMGD